MRLSFSFLVVAGGLALAACDNGSNDTSSSSSSSGSGGDGGNGGAPAASGLVYARPAVDDGPRQVWVSKLDGSEEKQLTQAEEGSSFVRGSNDEASFAPDAKRILFSSGRDFPDPQEGDVGNPTLRVLYTMKPDGTDLKRLTANDPGACSEHDGRFSPDGAFVVFSMACANDPQAESISKIYRIHADGTDQEKLPVDADDITGNGNDDSPVFSSDGKSIVFVASNGGTFSELVAFDLASMKPKKLTDHQTAARYVEGAPMVTSDGKVIFVSHADFTETDQKGKVERIGLDGSGLETLLEIGSLTEPASLVGLPRDADFSLSPDEKELVFVTYADAAAEPPTFQLAVEAIDGSKRSTIGTAHRGIRGPSFR